MADVQVDLPPGMTEPQMQAAINANEKYKNVKGGYKHLSSEAGEITLNTEEELARSQQENSNLLDRAMVDELTGLSNERALNDMMKGLEQRWDRQEGHYFWGSFIVADLTGLHKTNDEKGREAGDIYLKTVGDSLREGARVSDRLFRLGTSADEFVLYLPDITSQDSMKTVMDRIDNTLKMAQKEYQNQYPGIEFGLSYSAGTFSERVSPQKALNDAKNALGEAKKSKNGERVGTVGRIFTNEYTQI